ncbi:MAG: succinic semialdehyde dehydrogenase [Myxococcales bacterium]|jgi:succinate-semialdehyde dehydrogenase/glutarate-semialdehyde dehydrogenase
MTDTTHEPPRSVAGQIPKNAIERLLSRITLTGPAHPTAPLHAPFTDEPIHEVPQCTAEDLEEALREARAAQRDWSRRSADKRARVLLRFHDLVLERQDELLDAIQLETGKSRKHAFEEVTDTAVVSRYYAIHGPRHLAPRRRQGALPALTSATEYHQPLGVVGLIAPWSNPLSLAITEVLPALLAGNAVVLKPDEQTPLTALMAARLLDEAGVPPGLLHVLTGRGEVLGAPMIQGVDFIGFAGSADAGRAIARQAGERLIGCSLELAGKNPMIVLEDADLDSAADGAVRGCFANAGQLGVCIERLYVHASLFDRFVSRLVAKTRALKLGASFGWDYDVGSLVDRDQLERTAQHVRDAVGHGAHVAAGGRARPDLGPWFYEPTILLGVTEKAAVWREETFGPVVSVYKFQAIDEAVGLANASRYGLNASVWTSDADKGVELARRLRSGAVNINEAYAAALASVDAPIGGFNESGLGRRHGAQGLLKYTEAQAIAVQRLVPLTAPSGVSEEKYSRSLSRALKVVRRVPWLR